MSAQFKRGGEISGTYFLGAIEITSKELTRVFGEPVIVEDSKVNLEWIITFTGGLVATIYDWKREEAPLPEELISYHIGGANPKVLKLVSEALNPPKVTSIFLEVREWLDRVNGNSYFSALIHINGEPVILMPFQYGYGNHSEYEAQKILLSEGYLPQEGKGGSLFSSCQANGIDYYHSKSYTNKREMFQPREGLTIAS